MTSIFALPPRRRPGLFITGTDTEVGKTVVTCAIAATFARIGRRVGVCKPFASGCRRERGRLVSGDGEALAHFAGLDPALGDLGLVTPVTHREPVAPAVAMEARRERFDPTPIARSLGILDEGSDLVLVEGIGGVMVPIDPARPQLTVLDFMREVGYPVVVVTRADLGTLNHTALTCAAIRAAGCRLAGLVVNRYDPDNPDPAMQTNRQWLARMNGTPILATVPEAAEGALDIAAGRLDEDVRIAVALGPWPEIAAPPRPTGGPAAPPPSSSASPGGFISVSSFDPAPGR